MKIRRSLSMLGVAATALAGVAIVASPASASSGGGCGLYIDNVKACISASPNNGPSINFDVYTANGSWDCIQGQNPNLGVTIEIIDVDGGADVLHSETCITNHDYGFSVKGINGHRYHTIAIVNGVAKSTSPNLTFSIPT